MSETVQGTFHFHSTYSHDGTSTLPEIAAALRAQGFTFCVMTEHFEDFDAEKFERYQADLHKVSALSGLTFVPGMELHLAGLDTLLFPIRSFEDLVRLEQGSVEHMPPICKVLAHPARYNRAQVLAHLDRYGIDGIELWNQQSDGPSFPPLDLMAFIAAHPRHDSFHYFFGNDLHSAKLAVANVLKLRTTARTVEAIADALRAGEFVCHNRPTGIEFRNGTDQARFPEWLAEVQRKPSARAKLRRTVRRMLRSLYKSLPKKTQRSLNHLKNAVRNRI
jgi:hypothetical protein